MKKLGVMLGGVVLGTILFSGVAGAQGADWKDIPDESFNYNPLLVPITKGTSNVNNLVITNEWTHSRGGYAVSPEASQTAIDHSPVLIGKVNEKVRIWSNQHR